MIYPTLRYPLLILTLLLVPDHMLRAADSPPDFAKTGWLFLEKYCIGCHGGNKPKAELSLEPYRAASAVVKQRKLWDNVLKMIVAGEMPPRKKDRPRPSVAEAEAFTALVNPVIS